MRSLSVEDVQYTAHRIAQETMGWSEPIPDFSTRFTHALERSIEAPFQTFDGKSLYPGLVKKAAILFYLMVKNHPFQNGNKRIAVVTMLVFLYKNKKWLRLDSQELYNFAKWVAESNPKLKDAAIQGIETLISTYLVDADF